MKNGKQIHLKTLADAQAYTKWGEFFKTQGLDEHAALARTVAGGVKKLSEKVWEAINEKADA